MKNSTDNLILNNEKLKTFPLRSGRGQRCPLCHIFKILLEVLARVIRIERKKLKSIQVGNEEVKL